MSVRVRLSMLSDTVVDGDIDDTTVKLYDAQKQQGSSPLSSSVVTSFL